MSAAERFAEHRMNERERALLREFFDRWTEMHSRIGNDAYTDDERRNAAQRLVEQAQIIRLFDGQ